MEKNISLEWFKNIYWKLDEFSCILVLRNKYWFKNAIPILQSIWNTIQIEKNILDSTYTLTLIFRASKHSNRMSENIDIEELSSVLGLLTKEYNADLKKIKKN